MKEYLLVFIFQLVYIMIKFVNIRLVVSGSLNSRLAVTSLSSIVWMLTTSLGVKEMIAGNYLILVPYVLGAIIGVLLEHFVRRKI